MSHRAAPNDGRLIRVMMVGGREKLLEVATGFLQQQPGLEVVGRARATSGAKPSLPHLCPDIVSIDLDDPGSGALDEIRLLRDSLRGAGIIALTLSRGSAFRREALSAGADEVVDKGQLVRDLLPAIGRVTCEIRERAPAGVLVGLPEMSGSPVGRWVSESGT